MRTTLNLDANLLARAAELTGIQKKTELLHAALRSLIAHESAQRLAALGGTMPELKMPRRRRSYTGSWPPDDAVAEPPAAPGRKRPKVTHA